MSLFSVDLQNNVSPHLTDRTQRSDKEADGAALLMLDYSWKNIDRYSGIYSPVRISCKI